MQSLRKKFSFWLITTFCFLLTSRYPTLTSAAETQVNADSVIAFVLNSQKPGGGFGPVQQDYSELAWTYPAVKILDLMGVKVPRADACLAHGLQTISRTPTWNLYQETAVKRILTGKSPLAAHTRWTFTYELGKPGPDPNLISFHDLPSLSYGIITALENDVIITNREEVLEFVLARQTPAGGFADAETAEELNPADAHVVSTHSALRILHALGAEIPDRKKCVTWMQSCQTADGGFRWSPSESVPGNYPDVWYTWAAIDGLSLLDAAPTDESGCLTWLNGLQNADGGFADQPGWASRLYSTYFAVKALEKLGGNLQKSITKKTINAPEFVPYQEGEFQIYQAHFKSPWGGTVMVDHVHKLGLDLVGVKQYPGELTETYQYAKKTYPEMTVCSNPELYPHRTRLVGGRLGSHVANVIIPLDMTEEQITAFRRGLLPGRKELSWPDYQKQVIAPALKVDTLFYPEWDAGFPIGGMLQAYISYDDGVYGRPGYNAVHATCKLDGQDRIRLAPWRERYEAHLPFLADCDAHGDIDEYEPALMEYRNLFLSEKPDLKSFLEACRDGRTVCVLREKEVPGGVVYYGTPRAIDYVKRHRAEWQWWE